MTTENLNSYTAAHHIMLLALASTHPRPKEFTGALENLIKEMELKNKHQLTLPEDDKNEIISLLRGFIGAVNECNKGNEEEKGQPD